MRRSAAPSMTSNKALPAAKRGKFSTPFKSQELRKFTIETLMQNDSNSSQHERECSEKENLPSGEAPHESSVKIDKEPFLAVKETTDTFTFRKPAPKSMAKPQFQFNRTSPVQQVKIQEGT